MKYELSKNLHEKKECNINNSHYMILTVDIPTPEHDSDTVDHHHHTSFSRRKR